MAMFAVNAAGQVGQHNAKKAGVKARNRARLKQFDYENQDYLNTVKLDNAQWKNDLIASEVEQEQVFTAMTDQWTIQDQQLDELFADSSFKLQDEIIKMYENDYAGTQTGATAGRIAAKSAKEKGFATAKLTQDMILGKREAELRKEAYRNDAIGKIDGLFEKVRFPPMHGHTPIPPELEAKPSSASLMLGLATSAVSAYGFSKMTGAKGTGMERLGPDGVKAGEFAGVPDTILDEIIGPPGTYDRPTAPGPYSSGPDDITRDPYVEALGT